MSAVLDLPTEPIPTGIANGRYGGISTRSASSCATAQSRREQSFVSRGLVMHWLSVLASANPLREGQRFVRPSRKDAGRYLCGLRNGVF